MANYNRYPDEIIAYAREHGHECSIEEMAQQVTEKFGRKVGYTQMKCLYKNHHIHAAPMKGRPGKTKYPDGMGDYIREIAKGRTKYEIADLVNKKFGDGTITPSSVHTYKKNHKITTGLTGQFPKGNVPHNKGTHPPTRGRMAETQFKAGHMPHNWKPVGSERVNVDGYIEVKVAEPKTWKLKHRIVWEQHNGPIPEGMLVVFRDGNTQNVEIENLALVSRAIAARMNHLGIGRPGADAFDTALNVAMLAAEAGRRSNERKKARRGG